jgi:hypothetical protein
MTTDEKVLSSMPDKIRTRRTAEQIHELRFRLARIAYENRPLTIRHLFYLAVAAGLIQKDENEYQNAVIRNVKLMREAWLEHGRPDCERGPCPDEGMGPFIHFDWIRDAGRWIRKPRTYTGIAAALRQTAEFYRRDLWARSPVNLIFFCEKAAISEILYEETAEWSVPLAVVSGFSSLTFLYENAQAIDLEDKDTIMYFLGDHDGPGDAIIQAAVKSVRRYALTGKTISWQKLAVTPQQITELNLPLRPNKGRDTKYDAGCVEVDAIPPDTLRRIVRSTITQYVDHRELAVLLAAERSERDLMLRIAGSLPEIKERLTEENA